MSKLNTTHDLTLQSGYNGNILTAIASPAARKLNKQNGCSLNSQRVVVFFKTPGYPTVLQGLVSYRLHAFHLISHGSQVILWLFGIKMKVRFLVSEHAQLYTFPDFRCYNLYH